MSCEGGVQPDSRTKRHLPTQPHLSLPDEAGPRRCPASTLPSVGIGLRIEPMRQANQRSLGRCLPLELGSALDGWRLGNGPLAQRLATALTAAIERQDLLPGTKLPPGRLLAGQPGVARATVSAGYEGLATRGLGHR